MNSSRAKFAASRGNSKPTVLTRLVWSGTPRFWTHENAKENWVPKYLPSSHSSSSANAHNVTKRVFLRFRLHLSFLRSISSSYSQYRIRSLLPADKNGLFFRFFSKILIHTSDSKNFITKEMKLFASGDQHMTYEQQKNLSLF